MPAWFVYNNTTYYPYAEVVNFDTVEEAVRHGREMGNDDGGVVVFPATAHVWAEGLARGDDPLGDLRDDE